jgi:hypothetical protein
MVRKLRDAWRKWRENSRQYALERALYKAGGEERPARRPSGTAYAPSAGDISQSAEAAARRESSGKSE